MQSILFIDGRNFIDKIKLILNPEKQKDTRINFADYDFNGLLDKVLAGIHVDKKLFYMGKLVAHEDTAEKSEELIKEQRLLKTHLESQGFDVIFKELKTAIIGSSDSDLQPAVRRLKNLGVERIYLGFESDPNKGLTFTTSRTILIRNSEVKEFRRMPRGDAAVQPFPDMT